MKSKYQSTAEEVLFEWKPTTRFHPQTQKLELDK